MSSVKQLCRLEVAVYGADGTRAASPLQRACAAIAKVLSGPDPEQLGPQRPWVHCTHLKSLLPSSPAGPLRHGIVLLLDDASLREEPLQQLESFLQREKAQCPELRVAAVPVQPVAKAQLADVLGRFLGSNQYYVADPMSLAAIAAAKDSLLDSGPDDPIYDAADQLWQRLAEIYGGKLVDKSDFEICNGKRYFSTLWNQLLDPGNELIPFVGAGIGCGCTVGQDRGPTWEGLIKRLCENLNPAQAVKTLYFLRNHQYIAAATELYTALGYELLSRHLREIFPEESSILGGSHELSVALKAIVQICKEERRRLVMTLNYDCLLEAASKSCQIDYESSSAPSLSLLRKAEPAATVKLSIIHLHGKAKEHEDHFVFSKKQYINNFGVSDANFDLEETADVYHPMNEINLKSRLPDYLEQIVRNPDTIPIFVGCSLENDHILASVCKIRKLRSSETNVRPIAIMAKPRTDAEQEALFRRINQKDANVLLYPNEDGSHLALSVLLELLRKERLEKRDMPRTHR